MEPVDASAVFLACEQCIDRYIRTRRERVDGFVQRYFSSKDSLQMQKRSLPHDFISYPVNALWALPYMFVKKTSETLDREGIGGFARLFARVPGGIRTRYQREVESRVQSELLEWPSGTAVRHAFFEELHGHPQLAPLIKSGILPAATIFPAEPVKALVDQYSSGRAAVSDLVGSAGTMLLGWFLFKDRTLTVVALGDRFAHQRAQERAASHFFLGKGLGRAWYQIVPPAPTLMDIVIGTAVVGGLLLCLCLAVSVLIDPVRKALGLQQKTLHVLIDRLDAHLHHQAGKAVRQILGSAG